MWSNRSSPRTIVSIRVVLYEENTEMEAFDDCGSLDIHVAERFAVRYPNLGDVIVKLKHIDGISSSRPADPNSFE